MKNFDRKIENMVKNLKENTAEKELRFTLLKLIRENLLKGDIKEVAIDNNFKYDDCNNVLRGLSYRPEIIKALYDRALINKLETERMINNLNPKSLQ